jgi:hypothetical protein
MVSSWPPTVGFNVKNSSDNYADTAGFPAPDCAPVLPVHVPVLPVHVPVLPDRVPAASGCGHSERQPTAAGVQPDRQCG